MTAAFPVPPESLELSYHTLFQVRLLHHYFLDAGASAYDPASPDAATQPTRQAYALGRFWQLVPSAATAELLRRQRLVLAFTADGLRVAAQGQAVAGNPPRFAPTLPLPEQADFTFLVQPTDGDFPLYTDLDPAVLQRLKASQDYPQGQVLVLYNTAGPLLSGADSATTNQPAASATPLAAVASWEAVRGALGGGLARPLAVLCIRHGDPAHSAFGVLGGGAAPLSLLDADGYVPGRTYQALLPARRTHWRTAAGQDLGQHALGLHGRVLADYPNPTPATTAVNAAGDFISTIY